jgi:nucleotide-binding universal stress UspA family protein
MFSKVLVPLDGSMLAEQVLPYARIVAVAFQARVELFRAIFAVGPELALMTPHHYLHEAMAKIRVEADEYLCRIAERLRASAIQVSTTVRLGPVAQEIIDASQGEPDTVVTMCTHGHSGFARWVLGSVTDKVLRGSTTPLLVIRAQVQPGEADVRLSTVLVPLDGSEVAEESLPHAIELATRLGLRVTLVRVLPVKRPLGSPATAPSDADAKGYLAKVADGLRLQGLRSVETQLLHGLPAEAILESVKEHPQPLVVMTTHGRTGLGRWVIGSVTDRVVRESSAPVLVLHPQLSMAERPKAA